MSGQTPKRVRADTTTANKPGGIARRRCTYFRASGESGGTIHRPHVITSQESSDAVCCTHIGASGGSTDTVCHVPNDMEDDDDEPKSKPNYLADDNSEYKYAVLQRAARVFLFINPIPTNEEIATFIHLIYAFYNKHDEMVVYNIDFNGWHQAFNHTRNQKSTYKSRAIKAMGVYFKQALIREPDLVKFSDAELRQFWTDHYSGNAFLLCWPHLQGYVNPDQS